jgi:hypothetical protein
VIVRILGDGQYFLPDSHVGVLKEHDTALTDAVRSEDEPAFRAALDAIVTEVRDIGERLPDDELTPSDLVLPAETATIDEVVSLLGEDGVIPG